MSRAGFLLPLAVLLAMSCREGRPDPPPPDAVNVPGTLYVAGDPADAQPATAFGLALVGGGERSDEAYAWLIARCGGGDFVFLTTSDYRDREDDQFYRDMGALGEIDSLATLTVDSRLKADSDLVVRTVSDAELLFIDGGNQTRFYNLWSNTRLEEALRRLLAGKRVPMGGTSAGMAVLAGWAYLPVHEGAASAEVLANPYHRNAEELRNDFLHPPFLESTLTDTHWSERDRCGRTVAFMARLIQDGRSSLDQARAVACDEGAAVCIDGDGRARVFGREYRRDGAFFLSALRLPDRCRPGEPLDWRDGVAAVRMLGTPDGSGTFDLVTWKGSEPALRLSVTDGSLSPDIQVPD